VINDVLVGEPFNELVVAGRYGGIQAVVGYGSAVAATVSDNNNTLNIVINYFIALELRRTTVLLVTVPQA
jgi:hypothetical protein